MKKRKLFLLIIIVAILFMAVPSFTYALVATIPNKYYVIEDIMKSCSLGVLLIYIIASIIYLVKSKKSKKEKSIRLMIWLVVIIIICLTLWYGADYIIEII